MASQDAKYIVAKMSTVIIVPVDGINLKIPAEQKKIEVAIEAKLKDVINKLKASHEKFEDPDFGPNEKDEFGAMSFYGSALPAPAGSKYPAPETLRWERPQYDDNKFGGDANGEKKDTEEEGEEEPADDEFEDEFGFSPEDGPEVWCKNGRLFLDGTSSGDVIQGQLGDCWFLSALAVMGANESLLQTCFWKADAFKEYGLYVLRFYKDCNVVYVIVDDRLPVKEKDGKLIFAGNKDPNELWVPLIEKAYAKLHGCYKALIGGYTHNGLADMTGFCPRLIVMREGFLGYSEKYEKDDIWKLLVQYKAWNSLMGCSIQSNPKEKHKVEADAGHGLHMGHAYSLLGLGEIDLSKGKGGTGGPPNMLRLVKLRNPWGRGEWEGPYGDRSEEREVLHKEQIELVFNSKEREQERAEVNFNDGTFFMTFDDWIKNYTSLFVAVNFPPSWTGKRTQGHWSADQGGNRDMGTWISNPKIKFRLEKDANKPNEEYRQVFVGLYIKDSRLTMGCDYYQDPLYCTPLAFDIVTEAEMSANTKSTNRELIPFSRRALNNEEKIKQPPYNFGTTQVDAFLKVGVDYFIVPSLYKRNQAGTFFLNVFADVSDFHLDGSMLVTDAQKPMVIGTKEDSKVALKMSVGQYYDKKEQLRERIVAEAKRLNLSAAQLEVKFCDCKDKLTLSAFKRRMMDMGFMLTDFPDDDLIVLDADNDGTISHKEFIEFFREGVKFTEVETIAPPPEPPVDDLLYKTVDLAGELTVQVAGARSLRHATTWFNCAEKSDSTTVVAKAGADAAGKPDAVPSVAPKADASRKFIKYDAEAAKKAHAAAIAERHAAFTSALTASAKHTKETKASAPAAPAPAAPSKVDDFNATLKVPLTLENLNAVNAKSTAGGFMSPKSVNPRAMNRGNDAGTVVTGMSISKKELLQKAGDEAALKLHSKDNSTLQRAEKARTKFLGLLRNHQRNKEGEAGGKADETGVLRKKTKHSTKQEKRDITQDIDTMYLLNYWPNGMVGQTTAGGDVAVRAATVFPAPTPSVPTALARAPTMSAKFTSGIASMSTKGGAAFGAAVNAADRAGKNMSSALALPLNALGSAVTGAAGAVAAPAATTAGEKFKTVTSDLWDYLIDCVVTISISRPKSQGTDRHRALVGMKSRSIAADGFAVFDPCRTPIPAPTTRITPAKPVKGHSATPKTTRHTPGVASVTTAQSKSKQQTAVLDAKDKLLKMEKERGGSFEEVYRRLVRMPVTSYSELEGDRESASASGNSVAAKSHTYLRALFERFDKNLNGYISKEEFKMAMADMNVEVSSEDCDVFFNRFKGERPGNIDWKEFIKFFDSHLSGTTTTVASSRPKSIVEQLMCIKAVVADTASKMAELKISTLESFLDLQKKSAGNAGATTKTGTALFTDSPAAGTDTPTKSRLTPAGAFVLPDNAIFQNLTTTTAQVKTNVGILQKLGVVIAEEDMARISRIFLCKASVLMSFVRTSQRDLDMYEILDVADCEVSRGLSHRTGMSANGADQASSVAKLWSSLAPNMSTTVSFEAVAGYLTTMLLEANVFDEVVHHSPRPKDVTAVAAMHSRAAIRGVDAHILCRIIADTLLYSGWNRDVPSAGAAAANPATKDAAASTSIDLKSNLSFSGLDAYIRNNRINFIERKLKYLMQLETNYSGAEIYVLVHVYFSVAQDEFIILVHDPLSGDVYKLGYKEDLKQLPMGEKLVKMFINSPKHEDFINKKNPNAVYFYNPWETPAEDAVLTDLVSRLRIVRSKTSSGSSSLIVAEDPKFVGTLKALLDGSAALPFFSIINDLTLTFEVHDEKLLDQSSIRSFVFSNVRKTKTLCNFLVSVNSSLNVVLSTYNGGIRETFKWTEMLAHLTNYRNPFFTMQLLPAFLEPEQYVYQPVEDNSAFTGEDEVDATKVKSAVDYDGAPHPTWDTSFKFKFQPPQLTNCKVLSTEVAKMKIEDKYKYAVIMAREGKRTEPGAKEKQLFKFLTIYDPRSATDYQCGVKPGCKLYDLLYPDKNGKYAAQVDVIPFMQAVSQASEQDKILVGPAITPRLEVNVYNENGRSQELLGSCQISVSAVLSGSGISEKQRVCLTYRQEMDSGRTIDASAGDIQVEMRFRGQMMIEAEKQSKETHKNSQKKLTDGESAQMSPRGKPHPGDQNLAGAAGGTEPSALKGKLKATAGQLEDLRTTNDSLDLENRKLKEKVAATTAKMDELKSTGVNASLNEELQAALEDKARLASDKEKLVKEKAELAAEVARIAEQSKKDIAAAKEAERKVRESKPADGLTAEERKTAEDYKKLLDAYEQMRLKYEGGSTGAGTNAGTVAHSKSNQEAPLPALNKSSSQAVVDSAAQQDEQARKRKTVVKAGAAAGEPAELHSSVDDLKAGAEAPKVRQPTRPASAQVKPSTEDVGQKLRTSQSNNRMNLSATAPASPSVAPVVAPPAGPTPANPVVKAKTAVIVPTVGSAAAPSGHASTTGALPATVHMVATAAAGEEFDWSKVPLPPHWECKLPKGTSKYVYINHETKLTQWEHPLDPNAKQNRKAKQKKTTAAAGEPPESPTPV